VTKADRPPWLKLALSEVGYKEGAGNRNKFSADLGYPPEPWCDDFVADICKRSGHPLPSMSPGCRTGARAVYRSIGFAKSHNLWVPSWKAGPGFQICYGWAGPHSSPEQMHTGFVVKAGPKGSLGHTVEGNRGDQVERQTFTVGSDVILGTIDLPRLLLGRPQIKIHEPQPARPVTPEPQPRHPDHPHNTGPGADKTARDLSERIDGKRIATHKRLYRRLRRQITKGLKKGWKR
jgi:hypothetical protein